MFGLGVWTLRRRPVARRLQTATTARRGERGGFWSVGSRVDGCVFRSAVLGSPVWDLLVVGRWSVIDPAARRPKWRFRSSDWILAELGCAPRIRLEKSTLAFVQQFVKPFLRRYRVGTCTANDYQTAETTLPCMCGTNVCTAAAGYCGGDGTCRSAAPSAGLALRKTLEIQGFHYFWIGSMGSRFLTVGA